MEIGCIPLEEKDCLKVSETIYPFEMTSDSVKDAVE